MIYVLIVVSYFSGYQNGQTVTFQEFNSLEMCQLASRFIEEKKIRGYSWDNYKLTCIPKGEVK
jgi:hypothetical protein